MRRLTLQLFPSSMLSGNSQSSPLHLYVIPRHHDARQRKRRVWDLALGKCERVIEGHTGRLNSVSEFTFAPVYRPSAS